MLKDEYVTPIVEPDDGPQPAVAACVVGVAGIIACAGAAFVYLAAVYNVVVAVNYGGAAIAVAAGAVAIVGAGVSC